MAFGTHWEWRGFGRLPAAAARRLRDACDVAPDAAGALADTYLYVPGARDNVKLRDGQLKFKRLLARHAPGVELWREDPGEVVDFPLADAPAAALCAALGCRPPAGAAGWRQAPERLLAALDRFSPAIRRVDVRKRRETLSVRHGGVELKVELSRIEAPVALDSVAIEGPALEGGEAAGDAAGRGDGDGRGGRSRHAVCSLARELRLPQTLQPRNYLEMIARWLRAGR